MERQPLWEVRAPDQGMIAEAQHCPQAWMCPQVTTYSGCRAEPLPLFGGLPGLPQRGEGESNLPAPLGHHHSWAFMGLGNLWVLGSNPSSVLPDDLSPGQGPFLWWPQQGPLCRLFQGCTLPSPAGLSLGMHMDVHCQAPPP